MEKSKRILVRKIKKTGYFYPFFEEHLFRKISVLISVPLSKTKIFPPVIVFFGFLVALFGLWLISKGDYQLALIGGGILLVAFVLDCVDGEVARLTKQADKFGEFFDRLTDVMKESLLLFALASNYYYQTNDVSILYYALIAFWLLFISLYMLTKLEKLQSFSTSQIKEQYLSRSSGPFRLAALIFSNIYTPSFLYILIFVGLIFNQIPALFYFLIASQAILVVYLFRQSLKLRS